MATNFYNLILSIVYHPRIESDTYKLYPVFCVTNTVKSSYILRRPQKCDEISKPFLTLVLSNFKYNLEISWKVEGKTMATIFYNPILSIAYHPRIESDTYKLYSVFFVTNTVLKFIYSEKATKI